MKKEKEAKTGKGVYYFKPSFERYKKEIYKTEDKEIRKQLQKTQKGLEQKYAQQQAKIRLGVMPSEARYKYEQAKGRLGKIVSKALAKRTVSKGIVRDSKVTIHIPAPRAIEPERSSHFNKTYEAERRRMFFT